MGKMSRQKGNAFERRVAADLAKAMGCGIKQIYRTPLSGGHPYGDKGDLTIDPTIGFPFSSVECKHHANWCLQHVMPLRKVTQDWIHQAEGDGGSDFLLVMRGANTPIYALATTRVLDQIDGFSPADFGIPTLIFCLENKVYCCLLFLDLLEALEGAGIPVKPTHSRALQAAGRVVTSPVVGRPTLARMARHGENFGK